MPRWHLLLVLLLDVDALQTLRRPAFRAALSRVSAATLAPERAQTAADWRAACDTGGVVSFSDFGVAVGGSRLGAAAPTLASFTRGDGSLDPIGLAAWAKYERKPRQRPIGVAWLGALVAAIGAPRLGAFPRLVALQYLIYSFFEYGFHRFCMHAPNDSPVDRAFARLGAPWNRLHVQHHVDTNDDMTMADGYEWKAIRFKYATSRFSVLFGSGVSLAVSRAFRLGLPAWPTPLAASIVALYHGVLWNTLHTDSHDLYPQLTWPDGLPYVPQVPTGNRYARWLLTNHIGHHSANGVANYNIVFPGPDHLFGSFFRLKAV